MRPRKMRIESFYLHRGGRRAGRFKMRPRKMRIESLICHCTLRFSPCFKMRPRKMRIESHARQRVYLLHDVSKCVLVK